MECPDCGREVSTDANECPSCGLPDPAGLKKVREAEARSRVSCLLWFIGVFIIALPLLTWYFISLINDFITWVIATPK